MMSNFNSEFYFGIVTNNEDPVNLGRIKVKMDILNENYETDWIPVLSFYSGSGYGACFTPEIDSQVIIGFMNSQHTEAFVLGGIWSNSQKPPEENQDNNIKIIKSITGNKIIMSDEENLEKIGFISGNSKFEIRKYDNIINIESDGDIIINCEHGLKIEADNIDIECENTLKFESMNLKIDSSDNVNIESDGNVRIKGNTIDLN